LTSDSDAIGAFYNSLNLEKHKLSIQNSPILFLNWINREFMEAIRIKAYTKTRKQIKSIEDFLTKEGIEFEVIDKEEVLEFFNELESSLGQVKKIQEGKLKKEKAS